MTTTANSSMIYRGEQPDNLTASQVDGNFKLLENRVGNLAVLNTTEKSSLVGAVNEVLTAAGNAGVGVVVSVLTFGAIADPTNINAVAANDAAIAAAEAHVRALGGGVVYFPPGDYKMSVGLNAGADNVFYQGAGSGGYKAGVANLEGSAASRLVWAGSTTGTLVTFASPAGGYACNGGGLSGLMLDCMNVAAYGLKLVSWAGAEFSDVVVFGATNTMVDLSTLPLGQLAANPYDCRRNRFVNVYTTAANLAGNTSIALRLGRGVNGSANSCYNVFQDCKFDAGVTWQGIVNKTLPYILTSGVYTDNPAYNAEVHVDNTDNNIFLHCQVNKLQFGSTDQDLGATAPLSVARYNWLIGCEVVVVLSKAAAVSGMNAFGNQAIGLNNSNGSGHVITETGASILASDTSGYVSKPKFAAGLNLAPLAGDPSGAVKGDVVYNSTTDTVRRFNGSAWADLGAGATTLDGLNIPLLSKYGAVTNGADATAAITAAEADSTATYIDLNGMSVTTTKYTNVLTKKYFNGAVTGVSPVPSGVVPDATPLVTVKPQWPVPDTGLINLRTKTPILSWRGKNILWLGTSIPSFGNGLDSYPDIFANTLGCSLDNLAFAGSHCHFFPTIDPGDTRYGGVNSVKCLSMTEVDRQVMIQTWGTGSYYNDTDAITKASQMTCDYRIKTFFVNNGPYDCVMLDHAHNDGGCPPGTIAPPSWAITGLLMGGTTVVNGVTFNTLSLTIPGNGFAVGDGIALYPLVGITGLQHAAGRVISVSGSTVVAGIDATGLTGTLTSGTAIKLDRATIYGSYEFVIHYVLWCIGRYGNATCKTVLAGSFNEWTAGRNEPNAIYSVNTHIKNLAGKWSFPFFDVPYYYDLKYADRRDQGDGRGVYSIFCPDGTHPSTFESRQALANHWLQWAQGGAVQTIDSTKLVTIGRGDGVFLPQRELLYSEFLGGFGTPSMVLGDFSLVLGDAFPGSALNSAWAVTGTTPTVGAAPWSAAVGAVTFAGSASQYISQAVAGGAGTRLAFDLYLPSVTGLIASGTGIALIVELGAGASATSALHYFARLVYTPTSCSLQFGYVGNGSVFTYASSIPLAAGALYQIAMDMQQGTVSQPGGMVVFINGVKTVTLLGIADNTEVPPQHVTLGLISPTAGSSLTVLMGELRVTAAALLDYSTRFNGAVNIGTRVLNIVNGIITGVVGSPSPADLLNALLAYSSVKDLWLSDNAIVSGGQINSIPSLVTGGVTLTQTTSANQPLSTADATLGRNIIELNSTDSPVVAKYLYAGATSTTAYWNPSQPWTLVVAIKQHSTGWDSAGSVLGYIGTTTTDMAKIYQVAGAGGQRQMRFYVGNGVSVQDATVSEFNADAWNVWIVSSDGATLPTVRSMNLKVGAVKSATATTSTLPASAYFRLGDASQRDTSYIDMSAVLTCNVFDSANSGVYTALLAWLRNRYALSGAV